MTLRNEFLTCFGRGTLACVSVLAVFAGCIGTAASAYTVSLPAAKPITVTQSQSVARSLYGTSLPLKFGGELGRLGTGRILGGVETAGTGAAQALSTGVAWQARMPGLELLQFTGLQTGTEGAGLEGDQFLGSMLAQSALGDSWYAPSLGLDVLTLRGQQNGQSLGGSAFGLSLAGPVARGTYKLRLGRADSEFRPLGSLVPAGQTMLETRFEYPLFATHKLSNQFGLYQESVGVDPLETWSNKLQLTGLAPQAWGAGNSLTWRAGTYARRSASGEIDDQALDLSVLASHALGSRWLVSNALIWHKGFDPLLPTAPQARYTAWRLIGERRLGDGTYQGFLRPTLSLRRSVQDFVDWDLQAGVELQLSRLTRHFSMHINYVSPRLRSALAPAQAGMQVLLQFKFNANDARRLYAGVPW